LVGGTHTLSPSPSPASGRGEQNREQAEEKPLAHLWESIFRASIQGQNRENSIKNHLLEK
jgi:hypothetical protein